MLFEQYSLAAGEIGYFVLRTTMDKAIEVRRQNVCRPLSTGRGNHAGFIFVSHLQGPLGRSQFSTLSNAAH